MTTPSAANLQERLQDPTATFTQSEVFQAFENLAETYGYHRSPDLPQKEVVQETTSMVVDGYEHWGVLVIRPRTLRDSMITIPSVVDALLKDNMAPSQNTVYNATAIAMTKVLVVSPPGITNQVLESSSRKDLGFFNAFTKQYQEWMDAQTAEASEKKSGEVETASGTESASWSETDATSSPLAQTGSPLPKETSSLNTGK